MRCHILSFFSGLQTWAKIKGDLRFFIAYDKHTGMTTLKKLYVISKIFPNEKDVLFFVLNPCAFQRNPLVFNWSVNSQNVRKWHSEIKNLLYYLACRVKTKSIVVMPIKPSTETVRFTAPGSGVQTKGWGPYGHTVKMLIISKKIFFSIPIYGQGSGI